MPRLLLMRSPMVFRGLSQILPHYLRVRKLGSISAHLLRPLGPHPTNPHSHRQYRTASIRQSPVPVPSLPGCQRVGQIDLSSIYLVFPLAWVLACLAIRAWFLPTKIPSLAVLLRMIIFPECGSSTYLN